MNLLYVSHCAADAPDKGEKIRAFHFLDQLTRRFSVDFLCLTRSEKESAGTRSAWAARAAAVDAVPLRPTPALAVSAVRFALGASLTSSYYSNAALRARAKTRRYDACLVYSAAMAQYAPPGVPFILDLCDLDSEKWFEYSRTRRCGAFYAAEAHRLRAVELDAMRRAHCTLAMTANEQSLIEAALPGVRTDIVTNGVDFEYWQYNTEQPRHPSLVFVGQMDYYPNVDAALWFAREVLPLVRRTYKELRFSIVGRNPVREIRQLPNEVEGVDVVASPPDVRPHIAAASAAVAPIRLARGLQNKVLEALAMGKRVYASDEVCRTFGAGLPHGVVPCSSPSSYADAIAATLPPPSSFDATIIDSLRVGYSWETAGNELARIIRASVRR